jgi:membrane-associated phospholipid phosphatase
MKNKEKIAETFSVILSPVGVALLSVIIFTFSPINFVFSIDLLLNFLLAIFFLCLFPIIAILYSYKKGKVDIWVSDQSVRTPFYIVAVVGYITAIIVFYFLKNFNLFVLSVSYCLVTIAIMFGNYFRKISAHGAGVAGPITAITYYFGILAFPLFLLIPLTVWARLKLKAHTLFEVVSGILIATIITFFVYNLLYSYQNLLM